MKDDEYFDVCKISYKTKQDFVWFLEALDKIDYKEHIKIEFQHLPVPIEILINEYNAKMHLEYRDVLGPQRTEEDIYKLVNGYLKDICSITNELIIIDQYFFSNSSASYLKTLKEIFTDIKCNKIYFYVERRHFNEDSFEKIKPIFDELNIDIEVIKLHKKLHGRYYLTKHKGFSIDNSLNGILRKESVIHYLSDEDYKYFYKKYCKSILDLSV